MHRAFAIAVSHPSPYPPGHRLELIFKFKPAEFRPARQQQNHYIRAVGLQVSNDSYEICIARRLPVGQRPGFLVVRFQENEGSRVIGNLQVGEPALRARFIHHPTGFEIGESKIEWGTDRPDQEKQQPDQTSPTKPVKIARPLRMWFAAKTG